MKSWVIESVLESAGEAQVELLDAPPEHEGGIHPRRALPLIPDREVMSADDVEEMKRTARLN